MQGTLGGKGVQQWATLHIKGPFTLLSSPCFFSWPMCCRHRNKKCITFLLCIVVNIFLQFDFMLFLIYTTSAWQCSWVIPHAIVVIDLVLSLQEYLNNKKTRFGESYLSFIVDKNQELRFITRLSNVIKTTERRVLDELNSGKKPRVHYFKFTIIVLKWQSLVDFCKSF